MSIKDTVRLEMAVANASVEMVLLWSTTQNGHRHIEEDVRERQVATLSEAHVLEARRRLSVILGTLRKKPFCDSAVWVASQKLLIRDSLMNMGLKDDIIDDLIYAATP